MYLPPRIAASLTVTMVVVSAMAIGFWQARQSNLPVALSSQQASGLVLMAGVFALPVVLPNLGAAWAANRFGTAQGIVAYVTIFAGVFLAGFWLQLRLISKVLTNSPASFAVDRQVILYMAVNLAICLGAAFYFGKRDIALTLPPDPRHRHAFTEACAMIERISFGQAIVAAVYAAPVMAIPMVAASNNWFIGVNLSRLIGPLIVGALLLLVPAVVANVVSRGLIGWLGSGLSGTAFHIAIGVLAGALLIWIVDLAARGTVQIGGGPLGPQALFGMVLAACCNAGMIYAVWHFGWKSAYD